MGKPEGKKTPPKKADKGPKKPVKRLGNDADEKVTVAVRKSSRNAASKSEPLAETKNVKVTTAKKAKATKAKEPPPEKAKVEAENKVEEEDATEEKSETIEEEAKPDAETIEEEVEAAESSSTKAGGSKIVKVAIEHCKTWQVFKRKALENINVIKASAFADEGKLETELNPDGKSRKGAFEITVTLDDGRVVSVWSGLNRGPPRKDKFPEAEDLLDAIKKQINN